MQLSPTQIDQYAQQGYLCPIDVFEESQARRLRRELERVESDVRNDPERQAILAHNGHWVVPWLDRLARTPGIVEPVADLLGHDVHVLSVDLFVKEAHSPQFISWHQDLHYWGLEGDDEVTAWLALSPATRWSGCMRFVPGSHKHIVAHMDTHSSSNMLSRGQEIAVEVDERDAVDAQLQPGQMSLHHGRLFHASTANRSDDRRIGIAIRYVTPKMGLADPLRRRGACLVQGEDRFGHFELLDPPAVAFDPAAMRTWQRLREVEQEILCSA